MSSRQFGRTLVCAAVLPILLSTACSKRVGLDRGDANERVLARTGTTSANEPRGEGPGDYDRSAPPAQLGEFASPPADGSDDAVAGQQPEAPTDAESPRQPATFERRSASRHSESASPSAAPAAPAELGARADSNSAAKSRRAEPYVPREQRPGLGTSWGETRRSVVSTVSFQREDPTSPTSVARIYYNNASGIAAQIGERWIGSPGSNVTDLPGGFVSIEIVDPEGVPLPGINRAGRSFVVGHDGDRYAIRIRNHEPYRVEVVATVDGLDVIDGTTGNFQKRGYIIDGSSTLLIEGFRRSTNAVAAFRFGAVSDSYAARTGSDRNVGVIGIALFAERGCCAEQYSRREIRRRDTADPFPGQFSRPPQPHAQWRAN